MNEDDRLASGALLAEAERELALALEQWPEPFARSDCRSRMGTALTKLRAARARVGQEEAEARAQIDELKRSTLARDELLSIVGHELRNPLSGVFMQVLSMREQIDSGKGLDFEWVKRRVEAMEKQLHGFLAVLERILDVSRLGSGRIDLQLDDIDLNLLVHDVASRFERDARAAHCEIRVRAEGPLVGRWDRMRLEQIVANLVSNAVRYGAGKPVDVATAALPREARLTVRDQGIGISPADQARIFQRFERGERTKHGGFGVGLWVVKTVCDAMRGTIGVESAPGAGATFTVTLPRGFE